MPQRLVIAEALGTWRDAERLLADLPPESPDCQPVSLIAFQVRSIWQRLSNTADLTADVLAVNRAVIADAHLLLQGVRNRHQELPRCRPTSPP